MKSKHTIHQDQLLLGNHMPIISTTVLCGLHTAFKVYKLLLHTKRTLSNVTMGERANMQSSTVLAEFGM